MMYRRLQSPMIIKLGCWSLVIAKLRQLKSPVRLKSRKSRFGIFKKRISVEKRNKNLAFLLNFALVILSLLIHKLRGLTRINTFKRAIFKYFYFKNV